MIRFIKVSLCKRGGLCESLLPETITLTDEQFKVFLEKTILTVYAQKILSELQEQTAKKITDNTTESEPAGKFVTENPTETEQTDDAIRNDKNEKPAKQAD